MTTPLDSPRFAKIRPPLPQNSPSRAGRPISASRAADGGADIPVPGGPTGLRQRGLGPTFYFERQWRGKRIKLSLGSSLPHARHQAQEIINSIDRRDFSPAKFQQQRVGIAEFLEDALDAVTAKGHLNSKSVASYRGRIVHFLTYVRKVHPTLDLLSEVTPAIAHGFVEWRRQQKVSRSGKARPTTPRHHPAAQTVHDDVRRLRALFRVAVNRQQLAENPFASVVIQRKASDAKTLPRALNEVQVKRLLVAAGNYDKAPEGPGGQSTFRGMFRDMIQFYLLTGLRKEELTHLTWEAVEFDWNLHGRIQIAPIDVPVELWVAPRAHQASDLHELASSRARDEPLFTSKQKMEAMIPSNYASQEGNALMAVTPRHWDPERQVLRVPTRIVWRQKATQGRVPLIPQSRAVLKRRKQANVNDSPFVFPHPDRGPLRSDPLTPFKQVLGSADLPAQTRLHDLRHTFGFTLRRLGVPLEAIMGLMRHASIEETMIYAKYSDEEGAVEIQRLIGFGT